MLGDEVIISGKSATVRSFAKINLTLDVLGKRDNGYHDVEMIMQTVSLYDTITIEKCCSGIDMVTNLHYLPTNEKNIVYKAALSFFNYTGIKSGISVNIQKNIPVAAGMAGGSGNGAAALCALDKLFNTNLSYETLCELGVELGADVPYCIAGGTQLSAGIGEILTPLSPMKKCIVLLVKPPINISTPAIYERIDSAPIEKHPDTRAMVAAIERGDICDIADNLCNVMESVTAKMHPIIGGIKQKMINDGALGAVMSGSGPTVFGIFDDYSKAKTAHDSFAYQFKDVFLVTTV